ncbi:FkbM family methyltransferase [Undibacterium terreum]|uniref:Methyltransferase FkbM domain-containing protein n=1 Tax=Undibacterium terreum TaxID=1224302 RepID=A0A916UP05_9BURK|nr:FkbM family methyltransferase [Undibacterium terreum]GGC80177.1 hypothetical protein GCM10011396_29320 [Undibacterium terreum]
MFKRLIAKFGQVDAASDSANGTRAESDTILAYGDWNYGPLATMEDIYHCFRLLLGRPPNKEEWPGHSNQAGAPLDTIVASYLNSLEFARRQEKLAVQRSEGNIQKAVVDGLPMFIDLADRDLGIPLSQGTYEPNVTKVMREALKPGMNVLDIGANIGYYSVIAASLVGQAGIVYAVEPNSSNVKLIELSKRENGFQHIKIINSAAGEEFGMLSLNSSYSNGTTSALPDSQHSLLNSVIVPCVTLDGIIPVDCRIDVIKIDVEGFEYPAMRGAQRILSTWHPKVISEFSPDFMPLTAGVDGNTYLNYMFGLDYSASVIELDGSLLYAGQDIGKIMQAYTEHGGDHIDLLFEHSPKN